MKILIAPDSFKDCLTAHEVSIFIEKGILKELPQAQIRILPLADGGEGTVKSLVEAVGGSYHKIIVHDPLMRKVEAEYGIIDQGKTGVIEMSAASGIELLSAEQRDPWVTTSYGTGELILALLDQGCKKIILGLGGSATNDAGVGMAVALGVKFLDSSGISVEGKGGELSKITRIELSGLDKRILNTEIVAACDVVNPFTGPNGASQVYAPQKGADQQMADKLDQNLVHISDILKMQFNKELDSIPGSGAAGGMGGMLYALLNATIQPGFETISKEINLEENIRWADLIITGEGSVDYQSQFGKTLSGIGSLAKSYKKPVFAVAGKLGEGYEKLYGSGITAIFSVIDRPMQLQEAISLAPDLIEKCIRSIIRTSQIDIKN